MDYQNYHNNFNRMRPNFIHPQCSCAYHHAVTASNNRVNDMCKYPPSDHVNTHNPFFTNQLSHSGNITSSALQSQSIKEVATAYPMSPNTSAHYFNDPFQTVSNDSGSPTASNISNSYSSLSTTSSDNPSSDHCYAVDYTNNVYNDHDYSKYNYETMSNPPMPITNNAMNQPFNAPFNGHQQTHAYPQSFATYPNYTQPNCVDMKQNQYTVSAANPTYINIPPTANDNASPPSYMEDTKLFPIQRDMHTMNMNAMESINTVNAMNAMNVMQPTLERTTPATAQLGGYQCTVCRKKFKHKCNLKIHSIIHTPAALSCSFCAKKFARISNLNEHIKIHTNFRPFRCQYCDKTFRQKQTLIDHIRTHTGERPFKCDFCNKAFKVKHNLKSHRRLHTGERPFICPLCPKKFASKSSLNGHIRRKHPEYWNNRHRF